MFLFVHILVCQLLISAYAINFNIKPVQHNAGVRVIVQDGNSPPACPLLAICNVLILRNDIQLPERDSVSDDWMIEQATNYLSKKADGIQEDLNRGKISLEAANEMTEKIGFTVSKLADMLTGLSLDPVFLSSSSFVQELATEHFKLFDIPLRHAWVLDQNGPYFEAVGHFGYSFDVVQTAITDLLDFERNAETETYKQLAQHWLYMTANQLTKVGLQDLYQSVASDEHVFSVLFQGNHFHVIFKGGEKKEVIHLSTIGVGESTKWRYLKNVMDTDF